MSIETFFGALLKRIGRVVRRAGAAECRPSAAQPPQQLS